MKTTRVKYCVAAAMALLTLLSVGCARRVDLKAEPSQPAATATAELTHDKNGNTLLDLRVKHLARPRRLTPPRSAYLVWVQHRFSPFV